MAVVLGDRPIQPLTATALQMLEAGIIPEDNRLELLHGVLTEKSVKSPEHGELKPACPVAMGRDGHRPVEDALRVADDISRPSRTSRSSTGDYLHELRPRVSRDRSREDIAEDRHADQAPLYAACRRSRLLGRRRRRPPRCAFTATPRLTATRPSPRTARPARSSPSPSTSNRWTSRSCSTACAERSPHPSVSIRRRPSVACVPPVVEGLEGTWPEGETCCNEPSSSPGSR